MKIAIMGYGVVGSGVAEVVMRNSSTVSKHAGQPVEIKYILDLRDFSGTPFDSCFTKDFNDILNDDEVGVVAEALGGVNPAYDFTVKLLNAKKSVVTSNKELVAAKGAELLAIARKNDVNFFFEASVGGGIPVIRPLHQCLAANEIIEIEGILNGTTNYILTKMIKEGRDFSDVLAEAQKLGYAEKNPDADVLGWDACRKICILASLAYGKHVYPDNVYTEGVDKISLSDVEYAGKAGYCIKLIGKTRRVSGDKVYVIVAPMLVKKESPLSSVDGVFNAILIKGNMTDDVMFYGKGAGKLPTASAVVADIIDCIKHIKARKWLGWDDTAPDYVSDYSAFDVKKMINISVSDKQAALNSAKQLFGSIYEIPSENDKLVFITGHIMSDGAIDKLTEKLISDLGATLNSSIRLL